ncbi:MAG: hypothetical protein AB7V58_09965 [Solirubrobacterales bacterium]
MQTTEQHRRQRIKELLDDLNKQPPSKQPEAERLPSIGSGEALICQVITMGIDDIVLNPNSHRIKAQLHDDPEWKELKNEPYSEGAQRRIRQLVREARKPSEFAELKKSLETDGQEHPGVITRSGVLINANTRAVAISEFEDPAKRVIRVAVLPETVQPEELTLLELRLQMRKELKVDYTLTNELLFIDELSDRNVTNRQIANELRIDPEHPSKAEKEVATRLQLLDLIRELQMIPTEPLPLAFFDRLGYEQLRELLRDRQSLMQTDPAEAQRLMESFLLATSVDVTPVHSLRKIDADFMDDYMFPQLEDDEGIGRFAENLSFERPNSVDGSSGGDILGLPGSNDDQQDVDLKKLIDAVTGPGKRIDIPGTDFSIERDSVRDGVKAAILTGIKEKKRDRRDENKLDAPLSAVKSAAKQLSEASDSVKALATDSEFDDRRKRSLEMAFKKLRKRQKELEQTLTESEVLS